MLVEQRFSLRSFLFRSFLAFWTHYYFVSQRWAGFATSGLQSAWFSSPRCRDCVAFPFETKLYASASCGIAASALLGCGKIAY